MENLEEQALSMNFFSFYQYTTLSSCAVDVFRIKCIPEVVSKASTINTFRSPLP